MANRLDVSLPLDTSLSKNRLRGYSSSGVYRKPAGRSAQDAMVLALRAGSRGDWHTAPVFVRLDVTFARVGLDAINMLESVADALKVAISVDDKWFHASVRWKLDRDNPGVRIRAWQLADENVRYCPGCNGFKSLRGFRDRGVCLDCKEQFPAQAGMQRAAQGGVS